MKTTALAVILALTIFAGAASACQTWERSIAYSVYDQGRLVESFTLCAFYSPEYLGTRFEPVYYGPGFTLYDMWPGVMMGAAYRSEVVEGRTYNIVYAISVAYY